MALEECFLCYKKLRFPVSDEIPLQSHKKLLRLQDGLMQCILFFYLLPIHVETILQTPIDQSLLSYFRLIQKPFLHLYNSCWLRSELP